MIIRTIAIDVMKTLFELAKYNSKNMRIIELLMPSQKNVPLKKLFAIVFSGKFQNDTQVMQTIYGKKNLATFAKLKSKLKDILIKSTLLQSSEVEAEHSRINEGLNNFRYTMAVKMLNSLSIRHLAIKLGERTLVKSIKYHTTENILLLSRLLVMHFSTSEYNKIKLNKYLSIQNKYLRVYEWEIKAENYFMDLQKIHLFSVSAQDELKVKAKKYMDELESVNDIDSYIFYIYKYRVKAAYYEYMRDYESLLKISDAALNELGTPELRTNLSLHSINIRKAWTLIQIGRFDDVVKIGTKDMKDLPSGSIGWYVIAHYKLKAFLYKGDYKNAVDLIKSMIEEPLFTKIGGNFREIFYATLGYIHLIVNSGLAGDPVKLKRNLPDFKIGKFLNTIPVFSKDKKGINASILLMHVAFLLQRKDYNKIIDRIDSLNQYAFRHLRKDDTFRSNCMIKMVIQMTKADFNPIRTERYTRDLLHQLEQVKLTGSGENIETEIIPYEVLWKIMMKSL